MDSRTTSLAYRNNNNNNNNNIYLFDYKSSSKLYSVERVRRFQNSSGFVVGQTVSQAGSQPVAV